MMTPTRRQHILRTAAAAVATAVLLYAYRLVVDVTGFMPRCMFKWITGWDCPGCGSQRAFEALLAGNFREVLTHNLLLAPAMVYLGVLLFCYIFSDKSRVGRLHDALTSAPAIAAIAVIVVAWWVLRNLLAI